MIKPERSVPSDRGLLAESAGPTFARALWRVASARVTSGNEVQLLVDGPDTFAAMHDLIASARSSIDIEQYYWEPDEVGRGMADALMTAARRGVHVRVLIDWVGARHGTMKLMKEVAQSGCEVRVFNRPGWRRWFGLLPRDHRKVLVVDDQAGITGGVGIAEVWGKWLPLRRQAAPWRDTAVLMRGPAAADLTRSFLVTWQLAADERMSRQERRARLTPAATNLDVSRDLPGLIGIVEGEPGRARVARALQFGAVVAERSIWIASAYFLPSIREVEAITGAARDGVDVRILVPNKNDHPWVTRLSRRYYRHLLRNGVRIWEWKGAMMHTKMSVTDGRITRIGSTDLNPLGVAINYELDAFINDVTFGAAAAEQYLVDLDGSREITINRRSLKSLSGIVNK